MVTAQPLFDWFGMGKLNGFIAVVAAGVVLFFFTAAAARFWQLCWWCRRPDAARYLQLLLDLQALFRTDFYLFCLFGIVVVVSVACGSDWYAPALLGAVAYWCLYRAMNCPTLSDRLLRVEHPSFSDKRRTNGVRHDL